MNAHVRAVPRSRFHAFLFYTHAHANLQTPSDAAQEWQGSIPYHLEAWERGQHLTSNNHRRAVHLLQWYNDSQFMEILGSDYCETFRVNFMSVASACRELYIKDFFAGM